MEVSNEIKEDIRKTQSDLKNAIRVHQVWVARLQDDENNIHLQTKVNEAEKEIIAIGHTQKLVVDKLRRELELYQQHLKSRNKQISLENDNHYIAQQLRDHQNQFYSRSRTASLLKPSVLNEIHIKMDNHNANAKDNVSDSENDLKSSNEKENSNNSESDDKEKIYQRNFSHLSNAVNDRSDFVNVLNNAKQSYIGNQNNTEWQRSDSDSSRELDISPTPSPPPLLRSGENITKEMFLRLLGLITPSQKEIIEKKICERRKRSLANASKNDFLLGNYDMMPKRKKYNQFPYLQSHNDPPQTRSAKLRKQQSQNKSSREGSPFRSSSENKVWSNNKPAWVAALPPSLSIEPVYPPAKKVCNECGRNDVPSLLVWCSGCNVWIHTGCGSSGRCGSCDAPLPDPAHVSPARPVPNACALPTDVDDFDDDSQSHREKLDTRRSLQEKNIKLCLELRKLETRYATLKTKLDENDTEKMQKLAEQIKTQRNVQKLLDFISQFKETSVSIRSTSISESGSEISKSNEE